MESFAIRRECGDVSAMSQQTRVAGAVVDLSWIRAPRSAVAGISRIDRTDLGRSPSGASPCANCREAVGQRSARGNVVCP